MKTRIYAAPAVKGLKAEMMWVFLGRSGGGSLSVMLKNDDFSEEKKTK